MILISRKAGLPNSKNNPKRQKWSITGTGETVHWVECMPCMRPTQIREGGAGGPFLNVER